MPGGILESFGRLFKNDLKLYVYPMLPAPDDELTTVDDIKVRADLQPLYDYLAGRGSFVDLDNYKPEYLPIFSRDVLRRIAANDDSWESMVPAEVAELIKSRGFFGYVKPGAGSSRRERILAYASGLSAEAVVLLGARVLGEGVQGLRVRHRVAVGGVVRPGPQQDLAHRHLHLLAGQGGRDARAPR